MMMSILSKHTNTPTQSVNVGLMESANLSHITAAIKLFDFKMFPTILSPIISIHY